MIDLPDRPLLPAPPLDRGAARRVGVPVEFRDPADRGLDPHDPLPREHRALLRQPAPGLRQQPRHRPRLAQRSREPDLLARRSALRPAPVRLVLAGRQAGCEAAGRAHLPLARRRAAPAGHGFGRQGRGRADPPGLRQGAGRSAPAHHGARRRSRRGGALHGPRRRSRRRDRQRRRPVPQLADHHVRAARPVAGDHHPAADPVRPRAAQEDARGAGRRPPGRGRPHHRHLSARHRPAHRRGESPDRDQPRDPGARPHAGRQPRPRPEDARSRSSSTRSAPRTPPRTWRGRSASRPR